MSKKIFKCATWHVLGQPIGRLIRKVSRVSFMVLMLGVSGMALSANVQAATIFLVCDGVFKTVTGMPENLRRAEAADIGTGAGIYAGGSNVGQETFTIAAALNQEVSVEDEFDGVFYLSIDSSGGVFNRLKLQPFERDIRLPSLEFEPEETMLNGVMRSVDIVATDDELILTARSESGGMVEALVDGRPLTPTYEVVKDMSLRLNRFNGRLEIDWKDHEVRDYKPVGAIRSTKKRYSDIKRFEAMCKTMQERLF